MNQEYKSIYGFKKGDIITRLDPTLSEDGFKDFSLVGVKLKFLGIANACVYLSRPSNPIFKILLGEDNTQLKIPIALCEEGWSDYIEPSFLEEREESNEFFILEKEIEKAIKEEDYFKAEELKKKMEKLKTGEIPPPPPSPPDARLITEGKEPPKAPPPKKL